MKPTPDARRSIDAPGIVQVDHALWTEPSTLPLTHGVVSWTPQELTCRLITHETEPRTTFHQPNDPVHRDSCLEWFLAPWPGTGWYLNLETNSAGTLFAAFGTTADRTLLAADLRVLVGVRADVTDDQWSITWTVPADLLAALAGIAAQQPITLTAGTVMETNFYKCGDDTDAPHYGAWQPIDAERPQFHRPDQFGRLVLR